MATDTTSPKVTPTVLSNIQSALQAYRLEVESANMTDSSKKTYLLHAEHFVRWMTGDFEPGKRMK